ncbi:hypothetical protein MKW92_040856 [Papaver armeniacum]|nr:hypothetical protein MKW92_040856 [Papaver armeniacum]
MFTDGLDETAIKWIKQGTDTEQKIRSPLAEKLSLDPIPRSPSLCNIKTISSPHNLPPLKFYSGLLSTRSTAGISLDDDEESSAASVSYDMDDNYSDVYEEEGFGSSDTDLSDRSSALRRYERELFGVKSFKNLGLESTTYVPDGGYVSSMNRGSKENLRINVPGNATRFRDGEFNIKGSSQRKSASDCREQAQEQVNFYTPNGRPQNEATPRSAVADLGTPSAPPIFEIGEKHNKFEAEDDHWVDSDSDVVMEVERNVSEMHVSNDKCTGNEQVFTESKPESMTLNEHITSAEVAPQLSHCKTSSLDQTSCYSTSSQNAWQTMVAYDACVRLCLNAWARGCTEAPEFLRDECLLLRSAFGLYKFLLQPRDIYRREGKAADTAEEKCTSKPKRVVGKISVEVKKVRIVPRKKLKITYSQRSAVYMQAGAEYVRQVSSMVKNRINSLKLAPFSVPSEESFSCLFQLKSATDETDAEPKSSVCLMAGTGVHHVFFPENQGDALLLEVQDLNKVTQGRATIPLSSLNDIPSDRVRWWPIYHDGHECVGKVQLSIGSTITCDEMNPMKSGPVVETLAYDLLLESAMRAQHFHHRKLRLDGAWQWLLTEFSDYYGVSDSYTKLRHLSYIMDVATPTKDCLELVYELLVPVMKARSERSLTRQEKSILLDCETQVQKLLANVFENYKSLDELAPTGITDLFGPIPESAAPSLASCAATKRCRRHMVETDEFMSSNVDGLLMDPMAMSTAYLKMKNLCINISKEIQADIKIHNQHILPSSIDLSNIAASVYSTELCKRLRGFLAAWPPSSPLPHVTDLLIATADFERDLDSWNIRQVNGGIDSRNLFHNYIMVWIEDKQLYLLDLCKMEKVVPWSGVTTNHSTSPFAEDMYEKIKDALNEYEVVVNRWPQYSLILENAIANVERAVIKALEKQYVDILTPLKDTIPKKLGLHMQKLTRRQSTTLYYVPNQKKERQFSSEQMNGITVLLRTKYKTYMQATVEKLITNMQGSRSTHLKRILEETKESDGEAEVRERMQNLCSQVMDSISNLHEVFSSRIFVAICRGCWDRMGQNVLKFLESRKENRIWYNGSYYALGILDDTFASQMQRLQGNALEDKDIEPPRSVVEARSILCRDTKKHI